MSESKQKTQPSSKSQSPEPVVVKALKESLPQRLMAEGNLQIYIDDTYETALVYLYSSFQDYLAIHKRLFKSGDAPEVDAVAYSTFGESKGKGPLCLVWINNEMEKQLTIPSMAHEISHAVDDILQHAGVKDDSGEARAYLVEREMTRMLEKFYGIPCGRVITEETVKGYLK